MVVCISLPLVSLLANSNPNSNPNPNPNPIPNPNPNPNQVSLWANFLGSALPLLAVRLRTGPWNPYPNSYSINPEP